MSHDHIWLKTDLKTYMNQLLFKKKWKLKRDHKQLRTLPLMGYLRRVPSLRTNPSETCGEIWILVFSILEKSFFSPVRNNSPVSGISYNVSNHNNSSSVTWATHSVCHVPFLLALNRWGCAERPSPAAPQGPGGPTAGQRKAGTAATGTRWPPGIDSWWSGTAQSGEEKRECKWHLSEDGMVSEQPARRSFTREALTDWCSKGSSL